MAALAGSVARRYARALFQIGVARGTFERFGQELDALATIYGESRELRQTMENPIFKTAQKRAILEKLLPRVAPSAPVQSFALLLLERRRINFLPLIGVLLLSAMVVSAVGSGVTLRRFLRI